MSRNKKRAVRIQRRESKRAAKRAEGKRAAEARRIEASTYDEVGQLAATFCCDVEVAAEFADICSNRIGETLLRGRGAALAAQLWAGTPVGDVLSDLMAEEQRHGAAMFGLESRLMSLSLDREGSHVHLEVTPAIQARVAQLMGDDDLGDDDLGDDDLGDDDLGDDDLGDDPAGDDVPGAG